MKTSSITALVVIAIRHPTPAITGTTNNSIPITQGATDVLDDPIKFLELSDWNFLKRF